MSKKLNIVAAILAVSLFTSTATFALENKIPREAEAMANQVERKGEEAVKAVANNEAKDTVESVQGRAETQRQNIEYRKAELLQKQQDRVAARTAKLEGRRLAQCQNRQMRINDLMVKSNDVSQRHFDNVQKFEAGVKTFAEKKSINSEAYVASADKVDVLEAEAKLQLEVVSAQKFDCTNVDAAKPSDELREARESKRTALQAYRESVIELIKLVKQEFAQSQSSKEVE